MPKFPETANRKEPAVEAIANIELSGVLAHAFFIAAGVALGVRAADDLVLWREHRAAKRLARNSPTT